MPAALQFPPSLSALHFLAGFRFISQPLHGVPSGPSANPALFSGLGYFAPKDDSTQGYHSGYGARSGRC